MQVTVTRLLATIAVVIAIFLFLRVVVGDRGVDEAGNEASQGEPPPTATATGAREASRASRAAQPSDPPRSLSQNVPRARAPSVSADTPIHVEVSVPTTASVLDPFDAAVWIAAPSGVNRLRFAVSYNRKHLELTGVSQGDFAQRDGLRADVVSDEPSDGNVEVTVTVRDGHAFTGAGTVAILHFEPRRVGNVGIAVSNLTAFDSAGAERFHSAAPRATMVDVQ